tara:strand:- start:532 stop:762 length:231 start_codon:yes stop_codon:yes gene_type:complete
MSGLPYLPTEIVNKINNMAYDMYRLEQIQYNQEIRKNNINKLIESTYEDYVEEDECDSYSEYVLLHYSIFDFMYYI